MTRSVSPGLGLRGLCLATKFSLDHHSINHELWIVLLLLAKSHLLKWLS